MEKLRAECFLYQIVDIQKLRQAKASVLMELDILVERGGTNNKTTQK